MWCLYSYLFAREDLWPIDLRDPELFCQKKGTILESRACAVDWSEPTYCVCGTFTWGQISDHAPIDWSIDLNWAKGAYCIFHHVQQKTLILWRTFICVCICYGQSVRKVRIPNCTAWIWCRSSYRWITSTGCSTVRPKMNAYGTASWSQQTQSNHGYKEECQSCEVAAVWGQFLTACETSVMANTNLDAFPHCIAKAWYRTGSWLTIPWNNTCTCVFREHNSHRTLGWSHMYVQQPKRLYRFEVHLQPAQPAMHRTVHLSRRWRVCQSVYTSTAASGRWGWR
jgi:hypothetical protein